MPGGQAGRRAGGLLAVPILTAGMDPAARQLGCDHYACELVFVDRDARHRLASRGPVARFEDDHGGFGRPQAGEGVELRIDADPALP